MKGSTNATRGSADVVQNTSGVSVLDVALQNSTDSQPGLMSAADHSTLTTLKTTVAGKQDKLTFDSTPTSGSTNPVTSGGVYSAINTKSYRGSFSGDGSTKEFTLTHNLGAIPTVQAFDSTGQYFLTDMVCTTTTVKFIFNTAPASGASYTVVATI